MPSVVLPATAAMAALDDDGKSQAEIFQPATFDDGNSWRVIYRSLYIVIALLFTQNFVFFAIWIYLDRDLKQYTDQLNQSWSTLVDRWRVGECVFSW